MTQLGYTEGVNVIYDIQNPKGDRNLTKKMAKDLVAKNLDLYVPFSTTGSKAIQDAVKGTGHKIVFGDVSNYKELGIENLISPHKNITGTTSINSVYSEKRMEILKVIVPNATVFGIIWNPNYVSFDEIKRLNEDAAKNLNVNLLIADGTTNEEILASITSRKELGKQTAVIVDKVLKGASVDDLQIEVPALVELQLNARLAKEMGIEFPQVVLLQATVIKND